MSKHFNFYFSLFQLAAIRFLLFSFVRFFQLAKSFGIGLQFLATLQAIQFMFVLPSHFPIRLSGCVVCVWVCLCANLFVLCI